MIDITSTIITLRTATAQAVVKVGSPETVEAIRNKTLAKGDLFEVGKTAGLFAVKRTGDVIPGCHPLPVEHAAVEYAVDGLEITIRLSVKTIYKSGVEMEAMHGATVIALTMYDMLKPIDKEVEIQSIKLLRKKGGTADFSDRIRPTFKAGVIVCSDSVSTGKKEDKAGKAIVETLKEYLASVDEYVILPDEKEEIKRKIVSMVERGVELIILTGGTGLSGRDTTPEAVTEVLERRIPGIEEAVRSYGQNRTPYSMLSRSVAGSIGDSLVLALPGSTKGARESMDALFPALFHAFRILEGASHDS